MCLVSINSDFMTSEVTVSEEHQSTAWLDTNSVHVIAICPVGGEPPEPQATLGYNQFPASCAVVTVIGHCACVLWHITTGRTWPLIYYQWLFGRLQMEILY